MHNIVRAAVEVYPRETSGRVYGQTTPRKIQVENSYALQTTKRRYNSVTEANQAATERLRLLDELFAFNGISTNVIGGFHSHRRGITALSDADRHFAVMEMINRETTSWVEAVMMLNTVSRASLEDPLFEKDELTKKLRITMDVRRVRYKITVAAYELQARGNLERINIDRDSIENVLNIAKLRVRELKVKVSD